MANIFEQFQNCLNNKDYNETIGLNSFMFCRYLGSNPQTLQMANTINILYKTIPEKSQYDFIRYIPKKPKFIRFIGASKEQDDLKSIMEKYKVNSDAAKEYKQILEHISMQTKS